MNTTLIGIPASDLADNWNSISHWIADACTRSNGKYQPVDILHALMRGDMQLWGAIGEEKIEGIAIGEIIKYPRIKVYRMLAATGEDLANWIDHIEGIERWAKAQGCQDFESIARPGWARLLKGRGHIHTHSMLNKNLIHGGVFH